jgi:flavin-dependent dehydrogenase
MPVRCKVIIAADGLGHPSLTQLPQFQERVARRSRIGAGTSMSCGVPELDEGTIHMAIGQGGYAGLVRVEDGRLNIAAALNLKAVRDCGHLGLAVQRILQEAGFDSIDVTESAWTGTPQLTRRTSTVADGGVFVVGDSAGYVEPFTGEGIAWALVGGVGVAECAAEAVRGSRHAAAQRWQRKWQTQVLQRQSWCRRLAWLLKFSAAAPTVVRLAAMFPAVASPIVKHLNTGFDGAEF